YAAEGNSVDIELLSSAGGEANLEFFQQAINAIGMNATIKAVPGAEWTSAIADGTFDVAWYALGSPVKPRMDYILRSDKRNIAKHDIVAYDEAVHTARVSLDPAERVAAWQ